jgi:hypothetical protein
MKRLIYKDLLLFLRIGGVFLATVAMLFCGLIFPCMYMDYEKEMALDFVKNSVVYIMPLMAAMIATLLIQSSYATELKDKVLLAILSNGYRASEFWLSKLLTSYGFGYFCMILSFLIHEITTLVIWDMFIYYSYLEILYLFCIFPVIGFAIVSVLWLLMWVTKHIGAMIVGFVPTILYLLAVYLSYEVGGMINVALRFVVLALLGAIIMVVIILKLINRVSLEYISNLHR